MKTPIARLILLIVAVLLIAPTLSFTQSANREIAFINVNVMPMDSNRVLKEQTVLVRGDRIVEVGPASRVKVPPGAIRIDGAGKYLMPGFAEDARPHPASPGSKRVHGSGPLPLCCKRSHDGSWNARSAESTGAARQGDPRRDSLAHALSCGSEFQRQLDQFARGSNCQGPRAEARRLGPAQGRIPA